MPADVSFVEEILPDDQVSVGESDLENHAADWGTENLGEEGIRPDIVVYPESTGDVAAILAASNERGVPVTPYAAGTSLEGNAVPAFAGISMDLMRMDEILDVRPDDFQVDVQPGVIGTSVDDAVERHGLFFPPMPSSADISTIGGMIANDASGQQTVKYGEVADWVLELEVVLANGAVIKAGSKAVKTSSGYNLKDIIVGSEGTLGIVTRATLELTGLPEQIRGVRAVFSSLDDAAEAVFDAVRSGVDVAKIELIDSVAAMMANQYLSTGLPDAPMLFVEFHANHGVEEEISFCRSVFGSHGIERFEVADEAEMAELWTARSEIGFAIESYDPDLTPLHPGDITVPISKYPLIVRETTALGEQHDLLVPVLGHAGDGNLHYSVLVDRDDPEMVERGERLYDTIVRRAIDLGGTCTGEHGIGQGKRQYLELEHGEEAVQVMRQFKEALDPKDTLNPGKIFPETSESGGRVNLGDREGQ